MSKHTPGPWTYSDEYIDEQSGEYSEPIVWAGEKHVAIVRVGIESSEGNARLIAAAPDLLEALKRIMAGFDDGVWVRSIKEDGDSGWAMRLIPHVQALGAAWSAIKKAEGGA
jgi:hypothetical protein